MELQYYGKITCNFLQKVLAKNIRETIEYNITHAKASKIDEFLKGLIMKFVIAFNWRGFYGNQEFKDVYKYVISGLDFDKILIPNNERYKPFLETIEEENEHLMVLKNYREFLRDKGIIYETTKNYIRLMNIKFYISTGDNKFITSDNPSFVCKNIDGLLVHIMPISPKITIAIGLNSSKENEYLIEILSDKEISKINKIILDNSIKRIISIQNNVKF